MYVGHRQRSTLTASAGTTATRAPGALPAIGKIALPLNGQDRLTGARVPTVGQVCLTPRLTTGSAAWAAVQCRQFGAQFGLLVLQETWHYVFFQKTRNPICECGWGIGARGCTPGTEQAPPSPSTDLHNRFAKGSKYFQLLTPLPGCSSSKLNLGLRLRAYLKFQRPSCRWKRVRLARKVRILASNNRMPARCDASFPF
jgi:hypothetical protein